MVLSQTDVAVPSGELFGHTRRYYQQASGDYDGPNGFDWWVNQLPYAVQSGTSVAIVFDPNSPYWFDLVGGSYVPRYGALDVTLTENATAKTLAFARNANGRTDVTVFNDFTVTASPGTFVSYTDWRGVQTTITSQTGTQVNQLQRTYTIGGTTTYEALDYAYFTSGTAAGKLQTVTYSRKVGSTGSWTQISRAAYAYYGSSDANGSTNDLQSATQQVPNGSGGWNNVAVDYYRYWLAGSATGFAHALKTHFGPEAYRSLFNAGINLATASDATLQPYADQYFEYDPSTRRVTKEVAAVCASCPGGGTTSDSFTYGSNPRSPSPGYNTWSTKTTQALPDSSKIVVYTNAYGMPMLYVNIDASGSNMWATFYRYDANGHLIWEAQPSAVALPASLATLEAYDDLLNYNSSTGLYQYLHNSSGLIKVTDYYASTNIASGQVAGYVEDQAVQQGQSGTPILLRSYTYTSHADANGNTVYPVAERIVYPNAGDTTTQITTAYSYMWHSGTNVLQQKTTTLPAVPSGQNGDGTTPTIVEQYDANGQVTQRTNERGIVSTYSYSGLLDTLSEQVLNYQSGVTQPGVNVTSDFTYDSMGRLTQVLGPSHTVVLGGTATTVRPATWYVSVQSVQPASGTWGPDEDRVGHGYATGSSGSYTYTLVNPVTITRKDKDGRTTDQITSRRTTGSGALSATDTFDQGDWQGWTSFTYNAQHQLTSQQLYFLIPASGTGSVGTNYAQTVYGYDALERQNRLVSGGGTITRTVWTAPQRVASVWVGTNDTGATDANPAGSGSPNNMVMVTAYQYDGGSAGGDGNLTQITQYASATDTRVTGYGYDWRDRMVNSTDALGGYATYTQDNIGHVTQAQRYASSGGTLIGQSASSYDNRGRVYQQVAYAVDPTTGTVGNALTTNNFFDPSGNLIMQIKGGDGQVLSKTAYNGVGWITAIYRGYNLSGSGYSEATSLANDTILEQTTNTFDEVGNIVSQATYQRLNDATGTGALSGGTQPKARVIYVANWFDGIDRATANANYGAASSFTRPSTPPASSGTVLVNNITYDDAGRVYETTDPLGLLNQTFYDNAGRTTQTVESYVSGSTADDTNRTTNFTYTLDGLIATMVAVNGRTGNQTTTYTYGTTTSTSGVARSDLLASVTYPDSVSGSDVVAYTYNRQGQQATITDQRGTVRTLYYDKLGRQTDDAVTILGTGTDGAVRRISTAYEVRGMTATLTSYDNATPGSGTALNQVQRTYNSFSQLTKEQQEHGGTVGVSSPSVQYAYDAGASNSNEVRPTGITYPNGRVINFNYAAGMDAAINRLTSLSDGSATLASYAYLGAGTAIRISYPQPSVWLDLWGGTSGTFNGLDLFGRIVDQRWQNNTGTTPADIDRYQYGYDQNSNRLWKANLLATGLDEFYTYDRLNRLASMQRGTLNSTKTGISGTPAREMDYTLDPTGNWRQYVTYTSGTTDLNQTRISNTVNEITAIGGTPTWVTPAYDAAGNTTTMPQVGTPTSSYTATYDAWNRMVSLSAGGTTVAQYKYDGANRRIEKLTYTSGVLSETRHFFFTSQWQDVEERVGTSTSMDRQYVWGTRYVDELVCRDDATPLRLYALQDANFNLTAITDTGGTVRERYRYDPYGNRTIMNAAWGVLSSSAYGWNVGHQGLMHDVESGLLYNRNRMLHPVLGGFIQRDLVGYVDGPSLYEYLGSFPTKAADPQGKQFGEGVVVIGGVTISVAALEAAAAALGIGILACLTNAACLKLALKLTGQGISKVVKFCRTKPDKPDDCTLIADIPDSNPSVPSGAHRCIYDCKGLGGRGGVVGRLFKASTPCPPSTNWVQGDWPGGG